MNEWPSIVKWVMAVIAVLVPALLGALFAEYLRISKENIEFNMRLEHLEDIDFSPSKTKERLAIIQHEIEFIRAEIEDLNNALRRHMHNTSTMYGSPQHDHSPDRYPGNYP